jgi:phosphoribosylaminoimidazolecarboxamide formyltransferase / IMP cyclohydrolase
MASKVLSAVAGQAAQIGEVHVRRALISVFDKSGIVDLCRALHSRGVELISTGGTALELRKNGLPVTDVSDLTNFPEILGGRVKSLHPAIHGPLLAVRGNAEHANDLEANGLGGGIDLVVSNLYPFSEAVRSHGADPGTVIENIDIGGPTMLRAAAKNHASVAVVSSPRQYRTLLEALDATEGRTTATLRLMLASEAFKASALYDGAVSEWISGHAVSSGVPGSKRVWSRMYEEAFPLKYGNNPHQGDATVGSIVSALEDSGSLPFKVLSGKPGYINVLDAMNAWQLVWEVRQGVGLPAAASFKHVSPAGAALGLELDELLTQAYDADAVRKRLPEGVLTPPALAYLRARNADPLCSFGDFVALSHVVDEATALVIKPEVSDGIIAPGFEPAALEILRAKKKGAYIVLQADLSKALPTHEWREVHGVAMRQERNVHVYTPGALGEPVTAARAVPDAVRRDLTLAATTLKYTQSNSVGFAATGQMIGIGAGQQSRVDCVKLAARKAHTWWLRQHPKVLGLAFRPEVKRQERVNARVRFIEGSPWSAHEREAFLAKFSKEPGPLTNEEVQEWTGVLAREKQVACASDAFFPFRDGLDAAAAAGARFVTQPGGSVGDASVIQAADEHGMTMLFHGVRAFHH